MDGEPKSFNQKTGIKTQISTFKTENGSYKYTDQGKMFKTDAFGKDTVIGSDITVFVNLNDSEKKKITDIQNGFYSDTLKTCILEKQPDNSGREIEKFDDIVNSEEIYLGIIDLKTGKRVFTKKASLNPAIGNNAFEAKVLEKNGKSIFQTHLGDLITEVSNENKERKNSVKSFVTEKGSIYTYDDDGKTTRFKTATSEQNQRQDITVFANLNPDEEQLVLNSYRHLKEKHKPLKVYICEKNANNTGIQTTIDKREDVKNPDKLCLVISNTETSKIIWFKDVSLEPTIGSNAFDMRHFQEDGIQKTERHLGNKVVKVNY